MSGGPTADDFRAKVFRDREHTGDWRVEKLEDGGDARQRAIRCAEREYSDFDDFIARLTAGSDRAKPRRGKPGFLDDPDRLWLGESRTVLC